ncbi:translocon EspA [Escherichia coli]|uniref:Translocon EspA n=1 Tax=Escherichia coli TaxID=562 RepID=A0A376UFX4_ECOLX|nr:translocon EspA [Escherichia coli]
MDTSTATSVASANASTSTSTVYDLGSMSKDEVVQLFNKVGVFQAALLMFAYMYQAQSDLSIAKFADMNEASKESTTAQKWLILWMLKLLMFRVVLTRIRKPNFLKK